MNATEHKGKAPVNAQQLIEGDDAIASLPVIFYQLLEMIDDPDSSMEEIGELIGHDPGLSARVLRVVNSAFFSFPRRIETVSHAISIIGMQMLHDLVLSTIVINKFRGIPGRVIDMLAFWKHSIACGLAARTIASAQRLPNPERFFVAGLLHDIGRLAMCMKMPDKVAAAIGGMQAAASGLHTAERQALGFDHAEAGQALLKSWNLPPSHEEAVAFHHAPARAKTFKQETAVVHMADYIANTLEPENGGGGEGILSLDKMALAITGVTEDFLASKAAKSVLLQLKSTTDVFLKGA